MERAVDRALDLARMPTLAPFLREQALPLDLLELIRLVAGSSEAAQAAVAATGEPLRAIHSAAVFYLREMLFFPGADLHRNLGLSSAATRSQMRLHMRWLLLWLHPDHNSNEGAAIFAERVIRAWRELGPLEKQRVGESNDALLDLGRRRTGPPRPRRQTAMRVPWIAVPIEAAQPKRRRRARRFFVWVCAVGGALALILIPGAVLSEGAPTPFGTLAANSR